MFFAYFIEKVQDQVGRSRVVPEAVNDEDTFEILEFGEGKISRSSSISALFAKNAQAHVGLLNHAHIVGAVTDCGRHWLLLALFHQADNLHFSSSKRIKFNQAVKKKNK